MALFRPKAGLHVLLLLGVFLSARQAEAWESDVHFGLTLWLARQAGFSLEQSSWIAQGDQGVDDSSITDPVRGTVLSACTGTDYTGSSEVHDHHFPSPRGVPGQPQIRTVVPGQVQRMGSLSSAPVLTTDESSFRDLGKYLHALQDSWSHQGVPDFPDPPCDARLGWGHAFARGGWSCHLADLTFMWRDTDARETAKATYDVFVAQTKGTPRSWDDVLKELPEFIDARSKWEKHAWFINHGFNAGELEFLQEISLPDCRPDDLSCPGPYPFQRLIEKWRATIRSSTPPSDNLVLSRRIVTTDSAGIITSVSVLGIPVLYARVFRDFASAIVAGSSAVKTDLVDHALSRAALAKAMRISDSCPQVLDALRYLTLGPETMRGMVSPQPVEICMAAHQASLAGANEISCDAAAIAIRNIRPNRNGPDIREIMSAAQAAGLPPYVFGNAVISTQESYSVPVRFVHLPHDELILTARSVSGAVKIVGAVWMPNE